MPTAQAEQDPEELEEDLPAGQDVHACAPAEEYVPGEQTVQVTDAVALDLPAAHVSQEAFPVLLWNLPATHDVHVFDPAALYVPAAQPVHDAAPAMEMYPPAQAKQDTCPPLSW